LQQKQKICENAWESPSPVNPKKLKLDEETRWQIAGEAVEELRRYGGWKELGEEAPMRPLAKG
jgi:hypothetical protein